MSLAQSDRSLGRIEGAHSYRRGCQVNTSTSAAKRSFLRKNALCDSSTFMSRSKSWTVLRANVLESLGRPKAIQTTPIATPAKTTVASIRQISRVRYTGENTTNTDEIATTFAKYQRSGITVNPHERGKWQCASCSTSFFPCTCSFLNPIRRQPFCNLPYQLLVTELSAVSWSSPRSGLA